MRETCHQWLVSKKSQISTPLSLYSCCNDVGKELSLPSTATTIHGGVFLVPAVGRVVYADHRQYKNCIFHHLLLCPSIHRTVQVLTSSDAVTLRETSTLNFWCPLSTLHGQLHHTTSNHWCVAWNQEVWTW